MRVVLRRSLQLRADLLTKTSGLAHDRLVSEPEHPARDFDGTRNVHRELDAAGYIYDALAGVPLPTSNKPAHALIEEDPHLFRLAAKEPEVSGEPLTRIVVCGILEALALEPFRRVETIESEGPNLPMVVAVANQVEPLLVDEQRVRVDEEGRLTSTHAVVAHAHTKVVD